MEKYINYLKKKVSDCLKECEGACASYVENNTCKCRDAKILYHLEQLKEYKDAEEQGLLIKLPCKVGDTIYRFWYVCDTPYRIQEQTIRTLSQVVAIMEDGSFGKSVFLTREEADKALAELSK